MYIKHIHWSLTQYNLKSKTKNTTEIRALKEMRPKLQHPTNTTTDSAAVAGSPAGGNSTVPYLFGCLALVLGVIALALLILACSYRKIPGHSSNEEKSRLGKHDLQPEMEPRVVIMAGDTNPTYIATPLAATRHSVPVWDILYR